MTSDGPYHPPGCADVTRSRRGLSARKLPSHIARNAVEHTLRAVSLALIFVLVPLSVLEAQRADPLSPGMRVRITVDSLPSVKGTVVASAGQTFRIAPDNRADTIEVEYSRVDRLDVSGGMHNRVLHDALWGGGMLAALGAVVGAVSDAGTEPRFAWYKDTIPYSGPTGCSVVDPHCDPNGGAAQGPSDRVSPPFLVKTLKGAGIGAAAGLLAGAIFGHFRKSEVWHQRSPEQYRVHVAVTPVSGRGVAVKLSFAM